MMKKSTLLLCTAAWLMTMPAMAAVDDVFTSGSLKFKVITEDEEKKEVQVVRPDTELSGDVAIPESVENNSITYSVASIKGGETSEGCAFREMTGITSVTIPYTVYSMEYSAFYHCTGLKYVYNNGNMDKIDGWTFNGCTSLVYCRVPATITEIGQSAFEGSTALTDLVIAGNVTIKQNAFNGCTGLKALYILGTALTLENGNAFWNITPDAEADKCPKFYVRQSMVETVKTALNGKADWLKDFVRDEIPYTPTAEYTTFCRDFDVDFSSATGLKAGVAKSNAYADNQLTLTVVTSIAAGTGALLKGTAKKEEYILKIAETTPEAIENSPLKGVVSPTAIAQTEGANTNFVLSSGTFRKVAADNNVLAAGKAYLQLPTTSAARDISFGFDDDPTAINTVLGKEVKVQDCYDLQGRRVSQPRERGFYIVNGKKVIVR